MRTSLRRALLVLTGLPVVLGIVPAHAAGPSLRVSPPPGQYLTTQAFDVALIVDTGGLGVLAGIFTFDEADVTDVVLGCLRLGTTATGALTGRCPSLSGAVLGPGIHFFRASVILDDGSFLEGGAVWEVLTASNP